MPRYIDADALGLGKANRDIFEKPEFADGWNSAVEIIATAPAADVAEVVRCEECVYYYTHYHQCLYHEKNGHIFKMPCNGFCSYGERKEK